MLTRRFVILTNLAFIFLLGFEIFQIRANPGVNLANIRLLHYLDNHSYRNESNASLYLQGVLEIQQKYYQEAVKTLQGAQKPDPVLIHLHLAIALNSTGLWQEALNSLNLQSPPERKMFADILLERLPSLSTEEQIQWQQRIRSDYPDMSLPYAARLLAAGKYPEADEWAHLTPDYPVDQSAQLISGQSYFYRSGGLTQALQIFQSAYKQFHSAETGYWYGRSLAYNGQTLEAIPLLEEAVTKSGRSTITSWYLLELSSEYATVGRCMDASKVLDKALIMDSSADMAGRVASTRKSVASICTTPNSE